MDSIDTVIEQCNELFAQGEFAAAAERLSSSISNHPDNARLHYCRGRCFDQLDKTTEALTDFSRAIVLAPGTPKYYLERGILYAQVLHDEKNAILDCLRVIELDPTNAEALQTLSMCLATFSGQEASALHYAERLRELAPESAATHFCVGQAQLKMKLFSDAAYSLAQAVEIEPENAVFWSFLGDAYRHASDPNSLLEAVKAYHEALRLEPNSASNHMSLGQVHLKLGHTSDAVSNFRTALRLNPTSTERFLLTQYLKET